MEKKSKTKTLHVNRVTKAKYNFTDAEWFTCGVVLNGPDVKLAKDGQIAARDGYCAVSDGSLWLHNVTIGKDKKTVKLLVSEKEINSIEESVGVPGTTVVPFEVIEVSGWVKLKVAVVKGRRKYDKRQHERDKEHKKQIKGNE
jgi:SsrA-binding protein